MWIVRGNVEVVREVIKNPVSPKARRGVYIQTQSILFSKSKPGRKTNSGRLKIDVTYNIQFGFPIQGNIERYIVEFIVKAVFKKATYPPAP